MNLVALLKLTTEKVDDVLATPLDYASLKKVEEEAATKVSQKDPKFQQLLSQFIEVLNQSLADMSQEQRSKITLQEFAAQYAKIDASTISNILSTMKKPEIPATEDDALSLAGDEIVAHILKPTNEVTRMIQFYRNRLELELISNYNPESLQKLIAEFAENRVKFVRLHPLFGEIEKSATLKDLLCRQLEQAIKEELDLLYTQATPFGYHLALKHILPDAYTGFQDEDQFLDRIQQVDFWKKWKETHRNYNTIGEGAKLKRIYQSTYTQLINNKFYEWMVPKRGAYEEVEEIAPETVEKYAQAQYLKKPLKDEKVIGDSWDPVKDAPEIPDKFDELSEFFLTKTSILG